MKKMGSGTQTWDRMVINRVARDSLAVIVLCIGPFGISLEAKAPDLPDAMHNSFASNPAAVPPVSFSMSRHARTVMAETVKEIVV